jgi:hemoglobin
MATVCWSGSLAADATVPLHEAHKDLRITSEEFDEVGAEIASALDYFNVPEREKQEVLAAIVAHKAEVVNP